MRTYRAAYGQPKIMPINIYKSAFAKLHRKSLPYAFFLHIIVVVIAIILHVVDVLTATGYPRHLHQYLLFEKRLVTLRTSENSHDFLVIYLPRWLILSQ